MQNHLDNIFKKIELFIDKRIHQIDVVLNMLSKLIKKILNAFGKISNLLYELIHILYKKNNHDRIIRYATLPWGALFPKVYKYMTFNQHHRLPIFQVGMHMVRSRVGGGKSLTSFLLAQMTLEETGYASYFTSPVEKPQLSEDGKYWYVYHRVVKMTDYYKEGKKVMNFNTDLYKTMHKDERHLQYNPRMNKGRKYNDTFIPEHEDHLLMRHEGMNHIYMYSQHMKLDSQDMDSITYMHEVDTIKDIPVKRWLDDGDLKFIPVKLKFSTYVVEVGFDGSMKRKKVARFSLKVPYSVLVRFDTYAERYKHAGLKMDYK